MEAFRAQTGMSVKHPLPPNLASFVYWVRLVLDRSLYCIYFTNAQKWKRWIK